MAKTTKRKTGKPAKGKPAKGKPAKGKPVKGKPAKAGSKLDQLKTLLAKGATAESMGKTLGWQPHTLRAAISRLAKDGLKIERTRTDGVTSYTAA